MEEACADRVLGATLRLSGAVAAGCGDSLGKQRGWGRLVGEGELAAFSPPPAAGSAPGCWAEKGAPLEEKDGCWGDQRGFRSERLCWKLSPWLPLPGSLSARLASEHWTYSQKVPFKFPFCRFILGSVSATSRSRLLCLPGRVSCFPSSHLCQQASGPSVALLTP